MVQPIASAVMLGQEKQLLKFVVQTTVLARTKSFSVAECYRVPDLYIYDSFADLLDLNVRRQMMMVSAPARPYIAFRLKVDAYDKDVRRELPEMYLSAFEEIVALIIAQPGDKPGFLLSNGYANIFYVEGKNREVFAGFTYWLSEKHRWEIDGWRLVESARWGADRQILCPGTEAL